MAREECVEHRREADRGGGGVGEWGDEPSRDGADAFVANGRFKPLCPMPYSVRMSAIAMLCFTFGMC